jgi:Tfp pilus assembly protein PilV
MKTMRRDPQRGSAMLTAMILMSALLAGAAALVHVQMTSTRSAEMTRSGISAQYCAEAGLVAARQTIAANPGQWAAALAASAAAAPAPPAEPAFLASIVHDIDGDGVSDFIVYMRDNNDELPPNADDQAHDNDLRVYLVSRCTKYPDTPREVVELVEQGAAGHAYRAQEGGWNNNGNDN